MVGLFAIVTEHIAIVGSPDRGLPEIIRDVLDVDTVETTIMGSRLVGCLLVGNSRGVVTSNRILRDELEKIEEITDVLEVDTPMTCLGNVLAVNDFGGLAHPDLEESVIKDIEEFLDIEIVKGTVGGLKTVGMSVVATNSGALVNPGIREWEIDRVKKTFNVPMESGTVNFGTELVGTGVLANSKGYLVGADTTGFEKGRIEEALGFI
jgi:translation initiation factor 6